MCLVERITISFLNDIFFIDNISLEGISMKMADLHKTVKLYLHICHVIKASDTEENNRRH
jgi:hypothetical protein